MYRNILVVFWGDDKELLRKIPNRKVYKIFNKRKLRILKGKEHIDYYGCEFKIVNGKLSVIGNRQFLKIDI